MFKGREPIKIKRAKDWQQEEHLLVLFIEIVR